MNGNQPQGRGDLRAFFEPRGVAVAGSLREMPGTAFWAIRNLRQCGYAGPVYPINPEAEKYGRVFGSRVCRRVADVEGQVDLALVLTPPGTVPEILEACVVRGIKGAVVLSEGFAEAGEKGAALQSHLSDLARGGGIRILGPNTFGVVNTANGLATIPPYLDQDRICRGGVAVCSQTGSVGPHQNPVGDWAYPLSKMCDLGNKCDVDEADVLDFLACDPETEVVALHLEDIRDGRRFLRAARNLTSRKPLVVFKTGRSEEGARASASHTGAVSGEDRICEAALRQAGALAVKTWRELWEVPKTLLLQPLPRGNRMAVITFTGGQGVIAADAAVAAGLSLAGFSPESLRGLARISPRLGNNPVDIGPVMSDSRSQSSTNPFLALENTLPILLADAGVDCVTVTLYAGRQIVPLFPVIVDLLEKSTRGTGKTVNVWIYGTSLSAISELALQLQNRGLPCYTDLEIAIGSLGLAARYAAARRRPEEQIAAG